MASNQTLGGKPKIIPCIEPWLEASRRSNH